MRRPRVSFPCPIDTAVRAGMMAGCLMVSSSVQAGAQVPAGFEVTTVASGFTRPDDIEFANDGRIFVAEQRGMVWVVEDGQTLPQPFIDLRAEINSGSDRGLLGLALDPDFLSSRQVYLLYTVDPIFGKPDEPSSTAAFSRLTRYTGTAESNGNVADLASRVVLIGTSAADGIPVCDPSHTIGTVRFGLDGSLFLSAGDGARFFGVDAGGLDAQCVQSGIITATEDIGAFRSQFLGTLAGKVLRVDPATGLGRPSNPHWTGDAQDPKSKVWVNGLRNPYRFHVKPGSPSPGTLYVGDVGMDNFEELNVATGGENFGWPCDEGPNPTPNGYPEAEPDHSGCDTIETPDNPGPLTAPVITWHHSDGSQSSPQGFTGNASVAGVFYRGACYPAPFANVFFLGDYAASWIMALETDADDNFVALHPFAAAANNPVDFATHPVTGDVYYVALFAGEIRQISYDNETPGDFNGDCAVTVVELLQLLATWGPCPGRPTPCPTDLDGDGTVNVVDLLILLANWR